MILFRVPQTAPSRLMGICIFFGLASVAWGYNIGIMASIYGHPGFLSALGLEFPRGTTFFGAITSVYYVGAFFAYLSLSHWLADKYGRRMAAAMGILITASGALIQMSANGPAGVLMMLFGRIVCGVGLAVVSSSVPLYQSEVAPANHRGRYVVINHVGLVVGLATAFWIGYGISYWTTERGDYYGWRVSISLQLIPEILFLMGVFFCPESPRWLVEHGRNEAAKRSLAWLRALPPSHKEVSDELREIEHDIEQRKIGASQTWRALFTHPPLRNRLWRASLLSFMSQMAGNTSMKYFIVVILGGFGLRRETALLLGGIENTLKIAFTAFDSWLVDVYGRTSTLIVSCLIMSLSLVANGALSIAFPGSVSVTAGANYICILFIFIYTFGFSIGFGPAAWVYGTEIFPTNFRARGLNIASSASAVGAMISTQIWPLGMTYLGAKTHFIFASTNLISAVVIWLYYPETRGRSLEDMEALFNPGLKRIGEEDVEQDDGESREGSSERQYLLADL